MPHKLRKKVTLGAISMGEKYIPSLTQTCILLKNDQTYFESLALFTP